VPAGDLNASFSAKGRLDGRPAGELRLEIAKSRFAGMAAEGRVALATDGTRLARADADLSVGATKLLAKGSLGRAGDTLELKLASPDLAPIGRAFGYALGGRVDLEAKVSGAFAALSGQASFDAASFALPGDLRVAAASGRVELGAGDAGVANGRVSLQGLARRGEKAALVERASVAIEGTRLAHGMRLAATFPGETTAQAVLRGGIVPGARLPEWRGRLESLSTTGLTDFALSAPATLVVSAGRVELGEARFAGEPGEIRLAATRWTPAGLETRGSSNAVVVRTLRRILKLQGEVGSNLVLAGEWDVRAGETVDGFVSIRRERGDVRVGDPRQALGLEALALRVEASGGRLRASAEMRGKQAGRWMGEGSATLARGAAGWEISPSAPIEGRFTVEVPDLAWTAAWLGPEARAGGRLAGEGTLAGTLRDPTWSGRIEATGIALREPTLGAEVADGTIAITLKDREARIERFALSMPWQPSPEAARAIAAARRPAAGTVVAEGGIDLGTRKGSVRVKAEAWPLTRLATRFLAVSGEGRLDLDGNATAMTGRFTADAGWFGIPDAAPPSLSDDVIVERGEQAPAAARDAARIRLDLRVDLGEHLHFTGRGLSTRLAGALRLAGDVGANLRTTGTIRAVGGTYLAYGRTLTLERGALNFQGPIDNPGLNVLALRKGLPVEAGVEVLGTVARPKVRLVSTPDVPESEKLAWLVLGRGRGDVSAADAATLVGAASSMLGEGALPGPKLLRGLGLDEVSFGTDDSGVLGTMPQSTVAGRTGGSTSAEVVTVGKQLTDDIRVSYRQGLADAEGSFRVTLQFTRSLQFILRAGYLPGIDAAYRFSFK
jgi:translocation and assembly module TamB